ncbi:MAG: T9SS type A sorting domain-containing protein [Chlorobi bacterium]|nr:T9SS type A sorting domain-containing protein [Chlorobiota bacterium]
MKKLFTILVVLFSTTVLFSQQTGYYNGTSAKNGDELKTALHNIIKGHTPYSYYTSKQIFKLSDADPDTPGNVILVYTGRSQDANDFGTGGNYINREHVWAKSHGGFADWMPMYSDVHNLKPADASVNVDRSNKDFDNGGTQHTEATGCYYTDSTWEARDEVKGDIARIIFYMSTRYEGGDGEIDLEVVDWNNTYPNAQHGKLSTLLQWNMQDPPDDFERNRNNVIYSYQHNRNPFIDNPEWANMIWAGQAASLLAIDNIEISPLVVVAQEPVQISAVITNNSKYIQSATIKWGLSYESLTNEVEMTAEGNVYTGSIPGQAEGSTIYYQIAAADGTLQNSSVVYNFYVPKIFNGTIISIYDIQGQQEASPYEGQTVSTTGVVTANFGTSYFIQDGAGLWNGLFVYESGRNPAVGDSIVITGKISEYYGKTELSDISDYYFISSNNSLPEPLLAETGGISEGYESILTKVVNATCTDANYQADYYMWKVDDGSGMLKIHNTSIFEYEPTEGIAYDVTGPMNFDFDEWKIEIRFESDVTEGGDFTAPTVVSVEPVINTNIKILFDEDVETSSAENTDNYAIDNGIVVESASQHAFNKAQVNLSISSLTSGESYNITINNVKDLVGNVMDEHTESFSFVGIDEIFENGAVNVYPNPASESLNVEFSLLKDADIIISLSDISGKKLIYKHYSAKAGINKLPFEVSNLPKGYYLLKVDTNSGSLNFKIIVQ